MGHIINDAAELGLMLPKSQAVLYENIREFFVAESESVNPEGGSEGENKGGEVVGVCGLSVIWANLGEVVSLAVASDQRGRGLGRRLVEACLEDARQLGIRRVMSLTYEQAFFERLGFGVVDRQNLPLKVWADCVRCPKQEACDEIAMIRVFDDIPEPAGVGGAPVKRPAEILSSGGAGARGGSAAGAYRVPVVLTATATAAGRGGETRVGDSA